MVDFYKHPSHLFHWKQNCTFIAFWWKFCVHNGVNRFEDDSPTFEIRLPNMYDIGENMKGETSMHNQGMMFFKGPLDPGVLANITAVASRTDRPWAVGPGNRQGQETLWENPAWVFLPEPVYVGAADSAFPAFCHCRHFFIKSFHVSYKTWAALFFNVN